MHLMQLHCLNTRFPHTTHKVKNTYSRENADHMIAFFRGQPGSLLGIIITIKDTIYSARERERLQKSCILANFGALFLKMTPKTTPQTPLRSSLYFS